MIAGRAASLRTIYFRQKSESVSLRDPSQGGVTACRCSTDVGKTTRSGLAWRGGWAPPQHDKLYTASHTGGVETQAWRGRIHRITSQRLARGGWRLTYRMANLRGLRESTGKRKKQMKKHTAAPTLHATKMSIRSHRLTVESEIISLGPI